MIGYLGPTGTFSQMAALAYGQAVKPFNTIPLIIDDLIKNNIESAVLPIENTTEGSINATIDGLIYSNNIYIEKYMIMPIRHNLLTKKTTHKDDIEIIYSHAQGLAQCSTYLKNNFPNAQLIPVSSTAEGARLVSESDKNIASISNIRAKEIFNLHLLEASIEDETNNFTSFVKVGKNTIQDFAKGMVTTICFTTENKAGDLYKILDIFALWDINMTKIFSRPKKGTQGEYVFYVDLECSHKEDMMDALKMIDRKTVFFRNLGTYKIENYNEVIKWM